MTLDKLFNVLQSEQEQNKQEVKKEDVKQDFENLQNALVTLLEEVFGCNDDAEDTDDDVEQEQDQDSFDEILKNNIDVLARLKTCDNNTYAKPTIPVEKEPVLEPSKYSHWIIKYLWDTKGVIHKADYDYLRQFCEFIMNQ